MEQGGDDFPGFDEHSDPVITVGATFVDLLKSKKITSNKDEAKKIARDALKLVELVPSGNSCISASAERRDEGTRNDCDGHLHQSQNFDCG